MACDETAADRVRRLLAGRDAVEKKMMGGLSFMVRGNLCCGVTGAAVMVRVGAEAGQRLLTDPHVRPLQRGDRRPSGFVLVDPEGYRTDEALETWVLRGIDCIEALPGKIEALPGKPPKKRRREAVPQQAGRRRAR
jgi:hypothetical protein